MTGRQEHTAQLEKKIEQKLKGAPKIIRDYSYNFGSKTTRTKAAYIGYIINFCKFFEGEDITELRRSDINRYMEHIRYRDVNGVQVENKVAIRAAKLAAIKDFYSFLMDDGYINRNPCTNIAPPKCYEEKEIVAMNPTEIAVTKKNILRGCGTQRENARRKRWRNRDFAIITLGCNTGLRCTAITEIDISDIDFSNDTIRVVEKGNKVRTIYVGKNTMEAIKKWINDRNDMDGVETDALFISNRKTRISQDAIAEIVAKYTTNLNKHITPHKMRSSCATNLYEQTGDIYLVQEVLGHKNIANTRRYAKMPESKRRTAADVLDNIY